MSEVLTLKIIVTVLLFGLAVVLFLFRKLAQENEELKNQPISIDPLWVDTLARKKTRYYKIVLTTMQGWNVDALINRRLADLCDEGYILDAAASKDSYLAFYRDEYKKSETEEPQK